MKLAAKGQPIDEGECFAKLRSIQQEKLLGHWKSLTATQQRNLSQQIALLDPQLFLKQRKAIETRDLPMPTYHPFHHYTFSGNPIDQQEGRKRVQEGKVALLILAGGQGTRIQSTGPKGSFQVTNVLNKSLFQVIAEKVKAASLAVGRPLHVAMMTSPHNHVETQTFFAQHAFFGLQPSQITFFYQEMWPLLNQKGDLFLEACDQIAFGPNGNGGVFRKFVDSKIADKWEQMGVEQVNVVPIDNPLADPFDFELFGFQSRLQCDVVLKTALKKHAEENVGVLAEIDGKTSVIEYFEMDEADRSRVNHEGQLVYGLANLGLYSFTMPFIRQISHQALPLHCAKKNVKKWQGNEGDTAWKFEEFIFDVLPFAHQVRALLCPRESCFAPLKNLKGEDSIESVRKALLANDRTIFQQITGSAVLSDAIFELSPQFYYPTPELLKKWKGKPFPNEEYIHE